LDAHTAKVQLAETTKLKVLVIATQKTAMAGRISIALADVGFRVAALTPYGHPARWVFKIEDHFACHARLQVKSIVRAIDQWSPDLFVCADDLAVSKLQALHQRAAASNANARRGISELIEFSLGPATSFPARHKKSEFLHRVQSEGVRSPKAFVMPAGRPFGSVPAELSYPIVVKADGSHGGLCVRIVNSASDLRAAVCELQTPATWRGPSRRVFGAILGSGALARFMLPLRRTISLQQFIPGRPGNRAVVCWRGKVLAGISVDVVAETHKLGPASVVRVIDHPEMAIGAERMVKCLGLSGFVGFDFVLDPSDRAWLIEMNPRVTPICHFCLANGTNLASSLYRQLTGLQPLSEIPAAKSGLIAIFPNEILRCPSSGYLQSGHHDVPWNEPQFVYHVLGQALRAGFRRRVRKFLEHHLPAIVRALVRIGAVDPRPS
jgi:hypothetical protein